MRAARLPRLGRLACVVVAFGPLSLLFLGAACDRKPKPPGPATTAPPIGPDGDALAAASSSAVPKPSTRPPVCVVAYATPPPGGGAWFKPGDDVSEAPVPIVVPTGASLTLSVRRTGHEVTLKGPATFRPCTHAEPDAVLLADGDASTDRNSNVRPGAELYLATPGFVAIVGKATVKVHAGVETSTYDAEDSATFTNLDQSRTVDPGAKGAFKRYEEGATLITRCGVQVTAVASAESMLLGLTKDAGPPLPAASIGILTAQQIKHARERSLDCAFAGAYALACDAWTKAGEKVAATACKRVTYAGLTSHLAVAASVWVLPPGSPLLDAGSDGSVDAAAAAPSPAPAPSPSPSPGK